MKKKYLQPWTVVIKLKHATMLCASKGVTSDKGIGYGGVDEEGEKDPEARRRRNVWEE
ncbi:MAG: hypothetical protein K5896_05585 [Prevotella sp.]|nr:hypothetical protein [Prevotella sp.]